MACQPEGRPRPGRDTHGGSSRLPNFSANQDRWGRAATSAEIAAGSRLAAFGGVRLSLQRADSARQGRNWALAPPAGRTGNGRNCSSALNGTLESSFAIRS